MNSVNVLEKHLSHMAMLFFFVHFWKLTFAFSHAWSFYYYFLKMFSDINDVIMLIAPASQEQKSWTVAISDGAVCSLFSIGIVALSSYDCTHWLCVDSQSLKQIPLQVGQTSTKPLPMGIWSVFCFITIWHRMLANQGTWTQPVDTSSTMWAYFEIPGGMAVRISNESGEINNLCTRVCCDDF